MKPETLTKVRTASGMSRAAIAKHLQINRDTWSDYEAGKRPIPMWLALAVTSIYHRFDPLDD